MWGHITQILFYMYILFLFLQLNTFEVTDMLIGHRKHFNQGRDEFPQKWKSSLQAAFKILTCKIVTASFMI